MARLDGATSRIVLLGQSQGSCCALDAALTYRTTIGGVFCSIGQLYAPTLAHATRSRADRCALRIITFNGAADRCIAASLALRSYAELLDRGFYDMRSAPLTASPTQPWAA